MQDSPIVLTTLAGLSTGLGGLLAVLCPPSERLLAASAGFAGGVMLTASLADLMPEALAFYGGYLPPLACGGAVVSLLALGMLTAGLLGRLLPEEAALAARFGKSGDPARAAAMRTALVTGLALLLHNFPEGVLTFFAGTADPSLGLRTAAAIALHNIPEGLAVAVPFAYATRRRTAGVLAALVSGLAEPLGAVLAWLFLASALHAGLSERQRCAGGGRHGLGGTGPAAARCPASRPPHRGHFGRRRRLPSHAVRHCGAAVNVLYYILY